VEQQNFSIRKRTLEYDDVMNRQREIIYGFRGEILRSDSVRDRVLETLNDVIAGQAEALIREKDPRSVDAFVEWAQNTFPIPLTAAEIRSKAGDLNAVAADVFERVRKAYELKVSVEDAAVVGLMEKQILLQCVDARWQDYLRGMDVLRQGVGLRAYGQRDPLIEYKREAYEMFGELMIGIKQDISSAVFRSSTSVESFETFLNALPKTLVHEEVSLLGGQAPQFGGDDLDPAEAAAARAPRGETMRRASPKVGRNDPCPCGSGKKHKKCCGAK
jgi:preprotein translocase subunit SecA